MSPALGFTAGIGRDDLRAGVAAGILTESQAARLIALHDGRRGARENLREGDEPFELFRGFNEVFIVTGLAILAVGWMGASALWVGDWMEGALPGRWGGAVARTVQAALLGALILWGLSEYFVRRRRMVGPAIALSVLWAGNAAIGLVAALAQPFMVAQADFGSLAIPFALATGAVALHWLRFRVPFALAVIAAGLFATALVVAATREGIPGSVSDLFLLSAGGPFAWITLVLGALVFAAAMAFDLSDPHRVTRRAANGFWLHLLAAPMLVNTVALSLLAQGTALAQGLLLLFVALVALVAVVIDRRSFLVAGAGYVVTLGSTVFGGTGGALTVLLLGVALLLLGAFWERARAALLRPLAPVLPLHRLPPSA